MLDLIRQFFVYDEWANRRILASLKSSSACRSSALRFFGQILTEQKAWLMRLKGESVAGLDLCPELSLEECEILANETSRAYSAFFRNGSEASLPSTGACRSLDGGELRSRPQDMLVHVISTAAYRRGQLAAAIRAAGETPPDTDYLTFVREVAVARSASLLLSVVVPVYNEAANLSALLDALRKVLATMDCDYEFIFVNDGSTDDSLRILSEAAMSDARVKVLALSRNFGHQVALTAGLDFAAGDAVVVMDADLQDPPEIFPDMLKLFREGYDVVSAQRVSREGDGFFKHATAACFYWFMRRMVDRRLTPEVGDFRLFSHAAIMALRDFREQHRFVRGLVAWLGLKEAILPFHRRPRVAGSSKYPLSKMVGFAWTAISSFSGLPLRLSLPFGILVTFGGLAYLGFVIYARLILRITVPGWASLVALQVFFSGAMLIAIGLAGDYIARIYEEIKGRPLYVLSHAANITDSNHAVRRAIVLPRQEAWVGTEPGQPAGSQGQPVARKRAV